MAGCDCTGQQPASIENSIISRMARSKAKARKSVVPPMKVKVRKGSIVHEESTSQKEPRKPSAFVVCVMDFTIGLKKIFKEDNIIKQTEVMAAMSEWWHDGYLRKTYDETYQGSSSEEGNDEEEVNDEEWSEEEGDICPPRPTKKKSKAESKKKKKVPAFAMHLVQCFNPETCSIEFRRGVVVHITEEDVARVLGMPIGDAPVPTECLESHRRKIQEDFNGVKALNEIKASLGWRVVYSWVGDDPCGDGDLPPWSGVTCSTLGDYRVVTEFDLHNNKLTGPIPPQIGRLKRLKVLNLRWNKLQDVIPPEIGELKSLTHLYLSFNNFKGEIPKDLANLPELRYLYLHENRFIGRIPPELGTLQHLRHLDVGNNHLVGTIRELIHIEGCFPSLRNLHTTVLKIVQLTALLLQTFFIQQNVWYDTIWPGLYSQIDILVSLSSDFQSIPQMRSSYYVFAMHLYLDHNQFTGRISDAFYKHPFLKEMYIEGNAFRPGVNPIGIHNVLEVSDTEFLY
ncbi:hypothetical protein RHMOL_Rhmol12G0083100 [Rhododendron molle]|uniref:Uncharacterized protein n=1 Tax=Rhododendron molle TaxID=49168 RepID=A0ACC0LFK5_RHOML|nr:hypothetical protein RHMOL_Rhmol12G0083100 [Rhododendron molle]